MFIIQGHRFAHNGRVMNIILGADYADFTVLWLRDHTILQGQNPCNPRNPRLNHYIHNRKEKNFFQPLIRIINILLFHLHINPKE